MVSIRSVLVVVCLVGQILLPGGVLSSEPDFLPVVRSELAAGLESVVDLESGWKDPPQSAKTRCWWWWLNGNVTREGITRDLQEMKRQGLGGANIIDAGGADQRGHRQVPHGPDFGSPAWRELFVHAVREADRLDLELGLNIQSGWNLGGPTVTPEQAAKKLTWAETTIRGGRNRPIIAPEPSQVGGYYRDFAVLALPVGTDRADDLAIRVGVDSSQPGHPGSMLLDSDPDTFWVSGTRKRGDGPDLSRPQRIDFNFAIPASVTRIVIHPRPGYGPKRGWVQASEKTKHWRLLGGWNSKARDKPVSIDLEPALARHYRLIVADAYDPRSPGEPRNVQVSEVEMFDGDTALHCASSGLARIENFRQKAYHSYPGRFTAANSDHLLEIGDSEPMERTIAADEVIDITDRLRPDGSLDWKAPPGVWTIVRVGSTLAGSRVSTHSQGWGGWAIDYLDPKAFTQYWSEVVDPLLEAAGPNAGGSLRYLHTDSWELGPVNWTPRLAEEFKRRRGYDFKPYLPALAGYVVGDRSTSNRFLNDYRRTLADLIVDGNYGPFREAAHGVGLGIHPESGGPHAAPIDALACLGRSDIPMGEFWAQSKTHRTKDFQRFFVKQAASAAHTYGRRIVLAEAFTSIGPQWEEDPAQLKPVFDRVACEGLNLVMLHTFAATTAEMGLPGQAYFAGTHINPNTTWWEQSNAFFSYLNRCQFLLQQGLPCADVLHFYGENVPSFVRLKSDDPAGELTGYGYDVVNAEALINRVVVTDGKLTLPEGTRYKVLSLPKGDTYGLAALRKIAELAALGATVVGVPPANPIGLVSEEEEQAFDRLVARLWGPEGPIRSISPYDALQEAGHSPDFDHSPAAERSAEPTLDYFHRRTDNAEIYFVVNRTAEAVDAECSFRVAGPTPQLWDPVTGEISEASTFRIEGSVTRLPLSMPSHAAVFVVFRGEDSAAPTRQGGPNLPRAEPYSTLDLAWEVQFDSQLGGPEEIVMMPTLTDWSKSEVPGIKYYSGTATYSTQWILPVADLSALADKRCWLDLGTVFNLASVRLNGEPCGVAWTAPYQVELTGKLRETNHIDIEVVNLWPNRLIGDADLSESERLTKTNITKFKADTPLLQSGLLGPIKVMLEGK